MTASFIIKLKNQDLISTLTHSLTHRVSHDLQCSAPRLRGLHRRRWLRPGLHRAQDAPPAEVGVAGGLRRAGGQRALQRALPARGRLRRAAARALPAHGTVASLAMYMKACCKLSADMSLIVCHLCTYIHCVCVVSGRTGDHCHAGAGGGCLQLHQQGLHLVSLVLTAHW